MNSPNPDTWIYQEYIYPSLMVYISQRFSLSVRVWAANAEPGMNSRWYRLSQGGAWRQCTDPWADGLRRDCTQTSLTQHPPSWFDQRKKTWIWMITVNSGPEAGSHRALYLLLYTFTSRQRSISFLSRTQWLRTQLRVNNVPKYRSCDWTQPLGKTVGY